MPGASLVLDDNLSPTIASLVLAARHPGNLMAAFAGSMLTSTQRRFETETGPDGAKWKPLATRTTLKKIRSRQRGTANILRVTTRLYSSLTTQSDDRSASVGTNIVYAAPHQFGGEIQQYARSQRASFVRIRKRWQFAKRGRKGSIEKNITIGEHTITIPARPYLGFSQADIAALAEIGTDWLIQEAYP